MSNTADVFQVVPFEVAHGLEIVEGSKENFSDPVEQWRGRFEAMEKEGCACTVIEDSIPVACLGVYVGFGAVAWLIDKDVLRHMNLLAEVFRTFLRVTAENNGLTMLQTPVSLKYDVYRALFERVGFKAVGSLPDEPDEIMMKMEIVR
jgi:hypothetical protein